VKLFKSKLSSSNMKNEDVSDIAQLLLAMKDSVKKLRKAKRGKNAEQLEGVKKEILSFQKRLDNLI
jgi:hypothetical protein